MKSRRIFKIILITAVLVIILSIPAFATAKNGVVKSQANVRSGPGTRIHWFIKIFRRTLR